MVSKQSLETMELVLFSRPVYKVGDHNMKQVSKSNCWMRVNVAIFRLQSNYGSVVAPRFSSMDVFVRPSSLTCAMDVSRSTLYYRRRSTGWTDKVDHTLDAVSTRKQSAGRYVPKLNTQYIGELIL